MYKITLNNNEKFIVNLQTNEINEIIKLASTNNGNNLLSVIENNEVLFAFKPNEIFSILKLEEQKQEVKEDGKDIE